MRTERPVVGQHLRVHHGPGHLSFVLIRNRLPRKAWRMQTDVLGFGQNSGSYFQALPSDLLLIFRQSILSEEHGMEKTRETVPHGVSSHSRGQGSWQESAPGRISRAAVSHPEGKCIDLDRAPGFRWEDSGRRRARRLPQGLDPQ